MQEWMIPFTSACTVITMSYIAFKLRNHFIVQNHPWLIIPFLTGIASIILTELPFEIQGFIMDYSTLLLLLVALRYGFSMAFISGLFPLVYVFAYGSNFELQTIFYFILPAVTGLFFHQKETGVHHPILYKHGIISSLFYSLIIFGFHIAGSDTPLTLQYMLGFVHLMVLSAGAITIIIAMFNDENRIWLNQRALELKANHDELTKLPNIRNFMEIATSAIQLKPISIMMIDIDNFKLYNDHYGHVQGDHILQEVGYILRHTIGEKDYLARYGGEEFIVMCESTSKEVLYHIADRLCKAITTHLFDGQEMMPNHFLSISIGIAIADQPNDKLLSLISRADEALYVSKNNGKNQYTMIPSVPHLKTVN